MNQSRSCWYCGCPETVRAIALHHVRKRSLRPDLKIDPDNLCPLCSFCHHRTEHDQKFYYLIQDLWDRRKLNQF